MKIHFSSILLLIIIVACDAVVERNEIQNKKIILNQKWQTPDKRYGELFEMVQIQKLFSDGKIFANCTPKYSPQEIMRKFSSQKNTKGFDLKQFVMAHFDLPIQYTYQVENDTSCTLEEHIVASWNNLTNQSLRPLEAKKGSWINLPKPYVASETKYGEIYYWHSYFTMLGLQVNNQVDMMENILDNFAFLIDEFGYIPSGNRTYYLGRSHPPFFAAMVNLLAEMKGNQIYLKYHYALEKEYKFWMEGEEKLSTYQPTFKKVVRMQDGAILNRYWDENKTPRPESYKEDIETAKKSKLKAEELYRSFRAGAESGWDFGGRWLADIQNLDVIYTTDIIPVDLNSLLYHLEMTLVRIHEFKKNFITADKIRKKAEKRKNALTTYCWNPKENIFSDYNFQSQSFTNMLSLAGIYPLCFEIASVSQADSVSKTIQAKFLKDGGLISTLNHPTLQQDVSIAWSPLQWMTIWGLRNYQKNDLAQTIKVKWILLNTNQFKKTGKISEKYRFMDDNLEDTLKTSLPSDLTWSNAILLRLLKEK